MSFNLFLDTIDFLTPTLRSGNIDACSSYIESELHKLESTPFHIILDLFVTNDPHSAAGHFEQFFERESERFDIKASYTEMNDFNINPDRWYCDTFAYDLDGGHGDYDWLSDWRSEIAPEYEIKGFESLQALFASSAFNVPVFENAITLCEILIVIRFQQFMRLVADEMRIYSFPLYVSAHDYDFIARFPSSSGEVAEADR